LTQGSQKANKISKMRGSQIGCHFILGEWLFWWLLPKNNFAHGGKLRPDVAGAIRKRDTLA